MEKRSYAITGCRPTQFAFKYNERHIGCKKIKDQLSNQIILLYGKGVRTFYVKGALGVDLWAGEILLHLSDRTEFADMEISLVLPCENYDKEWDDHSKKRLEVLRRRCKTVTVLGSSEWSILECYRKCSKYEMEQAGGLLAVCDPYHLVRGDMSMMIKLAKRKDIPVTCILPNTGEIISFNVDR